MLDTLGLWCPVSRWAVGRWWEFLQGLCRTETPMASFSFCLSKSAKVWKGLSTSRTPTGWHRQPKRSHNWTWMGPRSSQGENGNFLLLSLVTWAHGPGADLSGAEAPTSSEALASWAQVPSDCVGAPAIVLVSVFSHSPKATVGASPKNKKEYLFTNRNVAGKIHRIDSDLSVALEVIPECRGFRYIPFL